MQEVTVNLKEELVTGNLKAFGDLLDKAWSIKKKMNKKSTNKKIDQMYTLAKKLGALGGKLLGAGTSGYMVIYASPIYQKKIEVAFKKIGSKRERLKFTDEGLEIWTAKR